jgi:serine/threonine transporter
VEFAATAEYHAWLKQGRQLPAFMYSKKERAKLGIEA